MNDGCAPAPSDSTAYDPAVIGAGSAGFERGSVAGMVTVETIGRIRRAFWVDHKPSHGSMEIAGGQQQAAGAPPAGIGVNQSLS